MMRTASIRAGVALMLAAALGGCFGGLLGGGKPDRLYRFGATDPVVDAPVAPRRLLALAPVVLPDAAAGDRILTVDGNSAAYVGDTRWLSPATQLFDEAMRGAIVTRIRDIALVDRATAGRAQGVVTIRIDRFEARYASADTLPEVVVEGQAVLVDPDTRAIVARIPIVEREAAGGIGAAALAAAFDVAVRRTGVSIADWVNASLPVPADPQPTRQPAGTSGMAAR